MLKTDYFIIINLYGFDVLTREFIEIAEVKKVLKEIKDKLLEYQQFTDTVDFVLIDIKSENYRTGDKSDRSFCIVETICTRDDGLLTLATNMVVNSLKNLFKGKDVLFLHRY